MVKLLAAVFSAAIFLVGCAGPKTFKDPSWTEHPKNLKIVYTEPVIGNADDLADDLPDYKDNFGGWFEGIVVEKIDVESNKKIATFIEKVSLESLSSQVVKLGDADFEAPAYESMDGADVYLVLSEIWVGRENEEYQTVQGNQASMAMETTPGSGVSLYKYFKAKCKYAFYDVKTKKILAYGTQEGKAQYQFAVTSGDWEIAVKNLMGNIVAYTPILPW